MKPNDPQHELPDELLSAYLDGELSAAEQAAVEERLKNDPAAQALVEELRAVSQAVQALPERRLDEDLRRTVLRRAEVQMLCGESSSEGKQDGAGGGNLLGEGGAAAAGKAFPFSIGRSMQGWVWSAAAIAAAVMIMVFGQQADQPEQRQVALQDAQEQRAAPELRATPQDGSGLASNALEKSTALADTVPTTETEEAEGLAGLDSPADGDADTVAAVVRFDLERLERSLSPAAAEPQVALSVSPTGPPSAEASPDDSFATEAGRAGPSESSVLLAGDEVLIVQLQASPVAQRSRRFEATLVSHGIVIEESGSPQLGFDIASYGQVPPQPGQPAEENVSEADALASSDRRDVIDENDSQDQDVPAAEGAAALADSEPAGVALYFVEAPAADMVALLTDLYADEQNFTALQIGGARAAAGDSGPAGNAEDEESREELAQLRQRLNESLNTRAASEAPLLGQSRQEWIEGGMEELEQLNRGVIPARQQELSRELFSVRDLPGINASGLADDEESSPDAQNAALPSDSQAARSQIQGADILEVDATPDAGAVAISQQAQEFRRGRRGRGGRGGLGGDGQGRGVAFEANNEAPPAGNRPLDNAPATTAALETEQLAAAEPVTAGATASSDQARFARESGAAQAEATPDRSRSGGVSFQPVLNAPTDQPGETQQSLQARTPASGFAFAEQLAEQRGRARRLVIVELADSQSPQTTYDTLGLNLQRQGSQGQQAAGGGQAVAGNEVLLTQPESVSGRRGRRGLGGRGFGGGGFGGRGGRAVGNAGRSAGDEVAQARSNRAAPLSQASDAADLAAESAGPAALPARRLDAYFYRDANGAPGQVRVFFVVAAERDEPAPPTPAASAPATAP